MLERGNSIILNDNKEYCVIDQFNEKGTIYIYLVDVNDNANVIFGKLDNDEVVTINDPKELEMVIKKVDEHLNNSSLEI